MRMTSESENVLKALSSSTRRTIMRQISEKGSATYTEIMNVLNLDPSLMSGTFNYHLKELHESGLVERTNGEYRITDVGKRALILVDQVAKDTKIDQYGVLSAVMSMDPRQELRLFMNQIGMIVGFVLMIFSLIPFSRLFNSPDFGFGLGAISFPMAVVFWIGVISFPISIVFTVRTGSNVLEIVNKFRLGFSAILFLSTSWFFIRSPNRNSFFIITLMTIATIIAGALTFLLPMSGRIFLYTPESYNLILITSVSTILTFAFAIYIKRKLDRLEESDSEQ
jgi:DNA-binding HxlR family transcriptional regulator